MKLEYIDPIGNRYIVSSRIGELVPPPPFELSPPDRWKIREVDYDRKEKTGMTESFVGPDEIPYLLRDNGDGKWKLLYLVLSPQSNSSQFCYRTFDRWTAAVAERDAHRRLRSATNHFIIGPSGQIAYDWRTDETRTNSDRISETRTESVRIENDRVTECEIFDMSMTPTEIAEFACALRDELAVRGWTSQDAVVAVIAAAVTGRAGCP